MATFVAVTPQVTPAVADNFIPEIWSDEVIATYESNLVLAPLVKKMSMKGKKGDTIHIPKPTRSNASAKGAQTAVSIVTDSNTAVDISIVEHWEYSRMIEDIADVQALPSMRRFYTSDAGYALARQVDTDLFHLGTGLGNGGAFVNPDTVADTDWVHSRCIQSNNGTNEAWAVDAMHATEDVFTDSLLRYAMQLLDDDDVPMQGRALIVPPSLVNRLRGMTNYHNMDFAVNKGIENGKIGRLYGVDVYISTNCPTLEAAGDNAADASLATRGAFLLHKDAFVLAEQVGVRSQTQYKQEFLSTLYTADRLYGKQVYRPENGCVIAVPEDS